MIRRLAPLLALALAPPALAAPAPDYRARPPEGCGLSAVKGHQRIASYTATCEMWFQRAELVKQKDHHGRLSLTPAPERPGRTVVHAPGGNHIPRLSPEGASLIRV